MYYNIIIYYNMLAALGPRVDTEVAAVGALLGEEEQVEGSGVLGD